MVRSFICQIQEFVALPKQRVGALRWVFLGLVDGEVAKKFEAQPKKGDAEFLSDTLLKHVQPTSVAL